MQKSADTMPTLPVPVSLVLNELPQHELAAKPQ
jgi:hypothetical protein